MKFPEAAPYVTKVGFGAQYAAALIINKSVHDGLPPELQTILQGGRAGVDRRQPTRAQQDIYIAAYGSVPEKFAGAQTFDLPPPGAGRLGGAMPNIAKEWAERIDAQGLPGSKVLAAYMEEMRASGAKPVRNWDQD